MQIQVLLPFFKTRQESSSETLLAFIGKDVFYFQLSSISFWGESCMKLSRAMNLLLLLVVAASVIFADNV